MRYNTTLPKTIEAITEHLKQMSDDELVNAHNIYCREDNNSDDEIFNNDEEFFNIFFEGKVLEAVRAVSFGEYNYNDDFVKFNGQGNLISFNSPSAEIDIPTIAEDIMENPENYDIDLEECFTLNGTTYEGTEDDAKDEYNDYKEEIESDNQDLEEGEDSSEILSFEDWAKENLTEV